MSALTKTEERMLFISSRYNLVDGVVDISDDEDAVCDSLAERGLLRSWQTRRSTLWETTDAGHRLLVAAWAEQCLP